MRAATIPAAVEAWLAEVRLNKASASTIAHWSSMGRKLVEFCQRQKIQTVDFITPATINLWRGEWAEERVRNNSTLGAGPATVRIRIAALKLFFKFVCRMDWNSGKPTPMSLIKFPKKGDDEEAQTMPLDEKGDKNYRALLEAIPGYVKSLRRRQSLFSRQPEYLVTLAELMYETGLRVGDAICFTPDKMDISPSNGWASYTTKQIKTETEVMVAIPLR